MCRPGSTRRPPPGARCRRRILLATVDARLIALDAREGTPCAGFGENGTVDLRRGLRNAPASREEYEVTSPPAVIGGLVIVGSAIADNARTRAASGEVRAYDARTGALRWTWDPVPQDPADPGWATWQGADAHRTGAANAWSVIAADPERDLVVVPTSSASPDYFGGERRGANLYANSVVALRGSTGARLWHFQVVHHDLWDYDVPAPPALVTVARDGQQVPAVLQVTKTGQLFVLHRESGVPIFPGRGAAGASQHGAGRGSLAHPALLVAARAEPAAFFCGRRVGHDALGPAIVPERHGSAPQRGDVHAAEPRGHADRALEHWRRRTGVASPTTRSGRSPWCR